MPQQFLVLRIKDTAGQIERKIKDALKRIFADGRVLQVAGAATATKIRKLFIQKMHESQTYIQLSTNSLTVGDFGLEHPKEKIDAIIEAWAQSLKLKFKLIKGSQLGIKGGFTISMVRSNYAEVFRLPQAKQRATSTRKAKTNQKIMPWLKWLLMEGDKKIIIGYDVVFRQGAGRSGLAIMVQGKKFRSWSVPYGISGTKDKNFVTEVLHKMEGDIINIMMSELARAARKA